MPSMLMRRSHAVRVAAVLLSFAMSWQLAVPVTYALAEGISEGPVMEEAVDVPEQGKPEQAPDAPEQAPDAPEQAPASDDGEVPQAPDASRLAEPDPAPTDGDPQPLSAAAPDDYPLSATVRHSGKSGGCSWSIDSAGLLRIWPTDGKSGRLVSSSGPGEYFPWYGYANEIKRVAIDAGVSLPSGVSGMFYGCSSLASLDASGWDTSRVTDMSSMFYGCSSLASLDLSNWDTSRVTNMEYAFTGCSNLARISVGKRYDTAKAFPVAPGGGRWRSAATGKTYTAAEIASGRRLVADTYTLEGKVLSTATIDPIPDQAYTGQALKPTVTVRVGSRKLVAGTDYAVSYRDNVEVGSATVTIIGRGGYAGANTATFRVVPASLSRATFAPISKQLRTGEALEPAVTVTLGGRTLAAGTDYTVSYANNVECGRATVTVTGRGNYTGTARATFEIVDSVGTVAVYRLYNWRTSEHLWTTSAGEYRQLPEITRGDWRQEGVAWYAPDGMGTPVYRLYNRRMGDHYYSMSQGEIRVLTTQHGWNVDNNGAPAFWSAAKSDPGVSPLFCVYNSRLKKGQHHFTASVAERDFLVANAGWRYEKEAFYGYLTKR